MNELSDLSKEKKEKNEKERNPEEKGLSGWLRAKRESLIYLWQPGVCHIDECSKQVTEKSLHLFLQIAIALLIHSTCPISLTTMSVTQDWSDALSHLTPGFLDFNFLSCEDAEARINKFMNSSPPSPYAVIRHIPLGEFEKLNECYSTNSRKDYFRHIELAVLYLKLPSLAHNWAFTRFTTLFNLKATAMGISDFDYNWLGNLTYRGVRQDKQLDECFFASTYVEYDDWPVLVIETGVSETIRLLQRDAVWWFDQHSEVRYVLLVSLDTAGRKITIEKWEQAHQPDTRSNVLEPLATEVVTIDKDGVTGCLWLSFSTLFKQDPGPSQHDFQFGPELRAMLRKWKS